ncbi:MAG: ABC transporter A family member [Clostridiales Family XIII bacterium]|nr:ABC transporter A subfamily ATP-binding protein [Clostridia bacterium]MDY3013463.1 ABC transporter A family member [Clostridiales Family XIII bacterium]
MDSTIQICRLTKTYDKKVAVDHLTLSIRRGEIFALLGVNGAGKTTTIRMLSCLTRPDDGDAYLLGNSIKTGEKRVKGCIGVSPQETAIARNLSVRENLELMAGVHGIGRSDAKEKVSEMIRLCSLEEMERKKAKTLSGGWQRRLSIAMALIGDPQILFLDEPTLGLDVLARRELWSVIRGLKGRATIILTTHYLKEAESLSDRIGIMKDGKLCAVGTDVELKQKSGTSNFEEAFVRLAKGGDLQ